MKIGMAKTEGITAVLIYIWNLVELSFDQVSLLKIERLRSSATSPSGIIVVSKKKPDSANQAFQSRKSLTIN
jgi:hypothetical protein